MTVPIHIGLGGFDKGQRSICAIFEGGGARGITHIGAIKAAEDERLSVISVAGSSAGAIIAALVAVGYTSEELYRSQGDHLLRDLGMTPIDLLGSKDWQRFVEIKRLGVQLTALMNQSGVLRYASLVWHLPLIWRLVQLTKEPIAARGLFNTRPIANFINDLLLRKINAHRINLEQAPLPRNHKVRFSDIDSTIVPQCASLHITVSNARSGELKIFNDSTPNVVIADAVAASAAIPGFFVPPTIEGANVNETPIWVDGGLIANLPSWAVRQDKRSYERWVGLTSMPVVAFVLDGDGEPSSSESEDQSLLSFIGNVARAGIFGSQKVVSQFVPDLVVARLPSPLGSLAFDCTEAEAEKAYKAGLEHATACLRQLRVVADLTTATLKEILNEVALMVSDFRTENDAEDDRPAPVLRLSLIDPVEDGKGDMRVVASAGMEDHADDKLDLDRANDIAPAAFQDNVMVFGVVGSRSASDLKMTKYERALLKPDIETVICVPVASTKVNRAPPVRVLCLDSNDSLEEEFNNPGFMQKLKALSVAVLPSLIEAQARTILAVPQE